MACAAAAMLIYASRDRLSWTPRPDQWMPLHEAALR